MDLKTQVLLLLLFVILSCLFEFSSPLPQRTYPTSSPSSSPFSSYPYSTTPKPEVLRIVRLGEKNMTTYSNRNLTITCIADLRKHQNKYGFSQNNFTTRARLLLSFFIYPRPSRSIPVAQFESFVHCKDASRKDCRATFNFDIGCIESRLKLSYYFPKDFYLLEIACQGDDTRVCSPAWVNKHHEDCHEIGVLKVIHAPRLGQECSQAKTSNKQCGENQICHSDPNICVCAPGFIKSGHKQEAICLPENVDKYWKDKIKSTSSPSSSSNDNEDEIDPELKSADFRKLMKWIVVFLLVLTVILCISLGAVIIWSRHYRLLLQALN